MASPLEQIALGFDQAKQTVYTIMKKYYPQVETSRSSLLNALISGIAYLYSTFQVFIKLATDELYISEATELSSLYKLQPLAGVQLLEPTPMTLECQMVATDPGITLDSTPLLYMKTGYKLVDANGYSLYGKTLNITGHKIFDFTPDRVKAMTSDNIRWYIPLGKLLNEGYLSQFETDMVVVTFPYIKNGILGVAVLGWTNIDGRLGAVKGVAGTSLNISQSTNASDLVVTGSTACAFNNYTGMLELTFTSKVSVELTGLAGQSITVGYTKRGHYKKNTTVATSLPSIEKPIWVADIAVSPYDPTYMWATYTAAESIKQGFGSTATAAKICVIRTQERVLTTSLIIACTLTGKTALKWDFKDAEVRIDPYFGKVFYTTAEIDGNTFGAYILDEYDGVIAWCDGSGATGDILNNFSVAYTGKGEASILVDQKDYKLRKINPARSINYATRTVDLEDTDAILFGTSLSMAINDAGYEGVTFQQVANASNLQSTETLQYFEVQPLDKTKVRIRFGAGVNFSQLTSMTINYETVKEISEYPAGTANEGAITLFNRDGTSYSINGVTRFPMSGKCTTTESGAIGIPDIETLRDVLMKAAYTYVNWVTALNYEYAIQNYYAQSLGKSAKIKAFDYDDFGTLFLDATTGNIVFYMGIKNNYPSVDPILVVTEELHTALPTVTIDAPESTRQELQEQALLAVTDVAQTIVQIVGTNASEVDNLRKALVPDQILTNYLLSDVSFVRMWAVYFKIRLRPKAQYSYTEAEQAVRKHIAGLFSWSKATFIREIALSDLYRELDSLEEVDRAIIVNMSHRKNDGSQGYSAGDITYKKLISAPVGSTPKTFKGLVNPSLNKISLPGFMGTAITASHTMNIGVDPLTLGFRVGMTIVLVFTETPSANRLATISAIGATSITTTELITAGSLSEVTTIKVTPNFIANGLSSERVYNITVDGSTTQVCTNTVINTLTADTLILNKDSVQLTVSGFADIEITDGDSRLLNPLWDFSEAASSRKVKIDVLALGGIAVEAY